MDIGKFFGHWIVKNIIGAVLLILALAAAGAYLLNIGTHHGQEIEVPDFSNMNVADAGRIAASAGIEVTVSDSVYVQKIGRGSVFSQMPKAGSKVKKGRRILLTINSVTPKKVKMPDLVGYSMRQAKAELLSKGLVLRKLRYVDDIATNNVLQQLYRGKEIDPGKMIASGSEIDLVVGLDGSDNQTYVPDVIGMKYMRALDALHDNSLNVSRLRFDSSVKTFSDTLDAIVYRQSPIASPEIPILIGSDVTLYLSVDNITE